MAAAALPTSAPADTAVADRLAAVELALHRLTTTINSKLASPTETLTVAQAAKRVKKCDKTVRGWIKLGVLSERRAGLGKGAAHLVLADELEVLITDGEDACRRYRERMGRD